jgi:hypothetical protein
MSSRKVVRLFSSVSTISPRAVIATNLVKLKKISDAGNEAELKAASSATIDVSSLPEDIRGYVQAATAGGAEGSKFNPDPSAWQNFTFGDFISNEFSRFETVTLFGVTL